MTNAFNHSYKVFILIAIFFMSFMLIGCGMMDDENKGETKFDPFLDDPDYYMPGDSVRGGDFSFLDVKVHGFIWDSDLQEFVEIQDGDYVPPGKHILGIETRPRRDPSILTTTYEGLDDLIEGSAIDQRVYASDGSTTYLVEAYLDPDTGLYLCDLKVGGTSPIYPLLIEVIYRDGMAKKQKILLDTRENVRANTNELVKEGLILGVSSEWAWRSLIPWAAKNPDPVYWLLGAGNYIFCDAFVINVLDWIANWGLSIDPVVDYLIPLVLGVLDISPGTAEDNALGFGTFNFEKADQVLTINANLEDKFEDGDVLEGGVALSVGLSVLGSNGLMLPRITQVLLDSVIAAYSEPISLDLDALLAPIEDDFWDVILDVVDIKVPYAEKMVDGVLRNVLPTNLRVYGHVFGRPAENTEDLLMVYVSGFLTDKRNLPSKDELEIAGRCLPEWPENTIMNDTVHVDLSPIKEKEGAYDVGVAVSGYMINSLMGQAGETFVINAPSSVVNFLFTLLPSMKATSSSELTGKIKFNPKGFTFDFHESDGTQPVPFSLMLHDMRFTILDNGAPITVISMDVVLDMSLALVWENGEWIADIGVAVVPEKSNVHLLEDKIGLTFLDHSNFLKSLVDVVLAGAPVKGINKIHWKANFTDILGVAPEQEGTTLSSKDGNVYLTLNFNDENPVNWDVLGKWLSAAFQL